MPSKYEEIYQKAVELGSWKTLVPYPYLLFRWQTHHPEDVMKIATLQSHRLGKHHWCDSQEKCDKIEQFVKENTLTQQTLTYGGETKTA